MNPVTQSRKQPGKCRKSLFKVSLQPCQQMVRREYETAVVEKKKKKKDVSNTVQQVVRWVRLDLLNNVKCHWERLGRRQQPALFNITILISTLGDYPRALRSHAAYSNQARSTKPPLLGPRLSYSHWLVLSCSIYGELLAGVVLSVFCDVSLHCSVLRWRESVMIVERISANLRWTRHI